MNEEGANGNKIGKKIYLKPINMVEKYHHYVILQMQGK